MGKKLVLLFFLMLSFAAFAADKIAANNDYLYSEEYFDYLIECANEEAIQQKENEEIKANELILEDEVTFAFDDEISDNFEPFRLRIEEKSTIEAYSETFKKPETKIIIPTSDIFSFTYNATQYINKNYTDGRRITSGVEYMPFKNLNFAAGVETNYRDVDNNPLSRKFYFTPSFKVNDYFTISFLNKYNFNNYSTDHDIGLYITPFKTKAIDFKAFAGITNEHTGTQSQSASFYTNFYFY
ncbi:MAG: hypothetical protein IJB79_04400 [Candidatus Gastranaerophilales bacterium]|nr:hypothetical protein [Candidatus Gastranaerophilales bacterium]